MGVAARGVCSSSSVMEQAGHDAAGSTLDISDEILRKLAAQPHPKYNVPVDVAAKVGRNLHKQAGHPLNIIKSTVEGFFDTVPGPKWKSLDDYHPVVTTEANFDQLLIPADHVSRSPSDTFYVNDKELLRCHTSAHQTETMRRGERAFLVSGDVYRRDAVDSSHYPVFHQMEGVRIYSDDEVLPSQHCSRLPRSWQRSANHRCPWPPQIPPDMPRNEVVEIVSKDLQGTLDAMVKTVFGDVEVRWIDEYFPFTEPSFEMEIFFQDEWLEVGACWYRAPAPCMATH